MTMSPKKRMRDFQRCLRSIQSFSDNQAKITEWDEENLDWFQVIIRPSDGYYEGGTFTFRVYLNEGEYPKTPPRVDCLTPIYHPNIDSTCEDYNVCLNLFDEWLETYNLEDVIQGLLFLLYNPNSEDPLSPYFDGETLSDESLRENIRQSLEGGSLDGITEDFPENANTEDFNEDELSKGIELILERACRWVVEDDVPEEEGKEDGEENEDHSQEELENNNNLEACSNEMAAESSSNLIMRTDSKVDKCEITGAMDCGCDIQCGVQTRSLWGYIPTWSDVLVTVARTYVEVSAGR